MKVLLWLLLTILIPILANAQILKLKKRPFKALGGKEFAFSISDSSLTLMEREKIIYREIKRGNVPDFLRTLIKVENKQEINGKTYTIKYYVLPDYFAIGSNEDYIYIPMTPILAQKVANITSCTVPTKRMVDQIYIASTIKLQPQPVPPTKAMITVPVFIQHTDSILMQINTLSNSYKIGSLTAGDKKDIIISNKIYGETSPRVVIYGWHKLDGKPIQPVYNKHLNTWADYSHGIRLVQNKIWLDEKKTSLKKVLRDVELNKILSDEGSILKPYYPIFKLY